MLTSEVRSRLVARRPSMRDPAAEMPHSGGVVPGHTIAGTNSHRVKTWSGRMYGMYVLPVTNFQ